MRRICGWPLRSLRALRLIIQAMHSDLPLAEAGLQTYMDIGAHQSRAP